MKKRFYKLTRLCVICGMIIVMVTGCSSDEKIEFSNQTLQNNEEQSNDTKIITKNTIYVYVTGSVKKPGVYEVEEDARVFNVIDLAGGFTKKAHRESLNLADMLEDGQCIHVMSKTEYDSSDLSGVNNPKEDQEEKGLVNINTALESQLTTLPGVGISKATAIITYREEHGDFTKIEDIMLVPGIKEACFSNIKDLITV